MRSSLKLCCRARLVKRGVAHARAGFQTFQESQECPRKAQFFDMNLVSLGKWVSKSSPLLKVRMLQLSALVECGGLRLMTSSTMLQLTQYRCLA
eukprot:4355922-Amphidinium_carterae.1